MDKRAQVIRGAERQQTQVVFDTAVLAKALRRVIKVSDGKGVKVPVNGVVTLSPGGSALAEAELVVLSIENNHIGTDLELGIDGKYLLDAPT